MSIKICTLNVKGHNNKVKRINMFKWLEEKKYNICLLQESHLTDTVIEALKHEWDGDIYLSGHHTNKQGITFLIKNNSNIKVSNFKDVIPGRLASLDITIHETQITLINVYGPNLDESNFYKTLHTIINGNSDKKHNNWRRL